MCRNHEYEKVPRPALRTRPVYPSDKNEILTVKMLADYLRCHISTVYRLIKHRELPAFRLGSDWRFYRPAVDRWINAKTTRTGAHGRS
ncbi:MAG TPA: helix-turn-helix domain-containing protein [Candidatus Binataceae bacterium]|nr:helix-turn-helix domain-containing protein [Candidatus Binataceae bacterium]